MGGLAAQFRLPARHSRPVGHDRILAWAAPVAVAAVVAYFEGYMGGDGFLFVGAGRTLLSTHWSHAFSNPDVQTGPLQLALFGSVGRSASALPIVLAVGTTMLVVAAARAVGVVSSALAGGTGALAVALGLTSLGCQIGHPADAVLPLLWIIAAAGARSGRARRAGLLIGLSAGLETWGILGVAVLALAPRRRQTGLGFLVAASTALALFLPFVVAGHFAMWRFHWHVQTPSPLSLVLPAGTAFGWPLRLLQGTFAVGAGVAVALLLRRSPHAVWVVPLTVVSARLLLDPIFYSYYLTGVQGPLLVGAALRASRPLLLRRERRESYA